MAGTTQVYHCAAAVSFHPAQVKNLYTTNVEGTANIVNTCLQCGVKKLLHVSSVAALGDVSNQAEIDETTLWIEMTNRSVYGKTKHLAEMEVWRGIGEGLEAVIINPSTILGNDDWNKGSSQIFKTVYNEFPWYTNGSTGFVDVQDVVKAAMALMNSHITSERFIINAENRHYKEIFDMIADGFHKKRPYRRVSSFLASLIWRTEAFHSLFTQHKPLLTKETAANAQAERLYSNAKFLHLFPHFQFLPLAQSIARICFEFRQQYRLT